MRSTVDPNLFFLDFERVRCNEWRMIVVVNIARAHYQETAFGHKC